MLRIDTTTKAADLFGAGKDGFRASNPTTGLLATQLSAAWANHIQEELCNVIEAGGLSVGGGMSQLLTAIQLLASIGTATTVTANHTLTLAERGLVLANASAGNRMITLPAADRVMDYVIRRVDNTTNKLLVQTNSGDAILHNTYVNSAGYSFIRLFGAGDFWWLRSDGAGNWHPISRLDTASIGDIKATIANLVPAGGWMKPSGTVLNRTDYPWLWDLAGVSGNLDTEANWAASEWGGFSTGDLSTTFRILELRGEFIRIWDDGHGVDAGRGVGQWKRDTIFKHKHETGIPADGTTGTWSLPKGDGPWGKGTTPSIETLNRTEVTSLNTTTGGQYTSPDVVFSSGEVAPRSIALPHYLKVI